MANLYKSVLGASAVLPTGNAVEADVLAGKTFSNSSGTGKTGTMVNNGAVSQTLDGGQSYTIPAGYHNGSGVVTAVLDAMLAKGKALFFGSGVTASIEDITSSSPKTLTGTNYPCMIYRPATGITKVSCTRLVNSSTVGYGVKNGTITTLTASTSGYVDSFNVGDYQYIILNNIPSTGTSSTITFSVE